MAYNEGQLSGSADYRVGLDNFQASQDWGGNRTTTYWSVSLQNPAGQGAWFLDNASWTCSAWSGTGYFNRPQSKAGLKAEQLGSGYADAVHDAAGYRHITTTAYIATPSAFIGSGGVQVDWDAARIPKRPGQPPFSIDLVTPNSFRVQVFGPSDDGGNSIYEYLIRVSNNPQADTPGSYQDFPGGGTSTIGDRAPGTRYYVTVYARNRAADNNGYSTYQASKAVDTLAGVWVSDGTKWVPTTVRASDGGSWSQPMPQISTGSAWQNPTNVNP